jgi:lipoprotein-anchoring transpeptidase ErfK/SrfK
MNRAALIAGISLTALLNAWPSAAEAWSSDFAAWPGDGDSVWSRRYTAPRDTAGSPAAINTRAKKARQEREQIEKIPAVPPGLQHIVVSIEQQKITLFSNGKPVATSKISSGTPGHPTPLGVFSVIQKNRHHVSNIYFAEMPYMQRLTWSGTALHQGPLPGYPASHGCVRLTREFAQLLWKATKIGVRVIVTKGEAAPVEIAHARLFVPKPRVIEAKRESSAAPHIPVLIKTADATGTIPGAVVQDATRPLVAAPQVNKQTGEQPTKLAIDVAELSRPLTPEPVEAARSEVAATPPAAPAPVVEAKSVELPPAPVPAPIAAEARKPVELIPAPRIMIEERAPRTTLQSERATLPERAPQSERTSEPSPLAPPVIKKNATVSVFISRQEGRLYVRHGMEPLFDTPIAIAQPERPLGTHVYTAMEKTDGDALRWTVVSIPSSYKRAAEPKKNEIGKKSKDKPTKTVAVEAGPSSNANEALERLVLPPEAVARISELVGPGASLVISDNKLSSETGRGTDFIVLTQ